MDGRNGPPKKDDDEHIYKALLERQADRVLNPLQQYIKSQTNAVSLLIIATISALFLANNIYTAGFYHSLLEMPISLTFGNFRFEASLHYWVSDILLTFFFLLVGLEIKREIIGGELSHPKQTTLILFAALGGMLIPAAIFAGFNYGTPHIKGWGIPIATDTAFSLGLLAIFRRKLPEGVFAFIATLAILDDIGAVLLIATFYSKHFSGFYLSLAVLAIAPLILGNIFGIRNTVFYVMLGIPSWYLLEASGVHGVIAGVVVAFCVPARPSKGPISSIKNLNELLLIFQKRKKEDPGALSDKHHQKMIEDIQKAAKQASTPLQRLESEFELPIALVVLPLFALLNAGIELNYANILSGLSSHLSWGIIAGLVLGKPIGIVLFSLLSMILNIGKLPNNVTMHHVVGVSMFAGIGFTMSLFINNLAFHASAISLNTAKFGVLFGSLISFILGSIYLYCCVNKGNS